MNGDGARSALSVPALEQPRSIAAGSSSLVEFALEDVACRIELVGVDRGRKLAAYDVLLANVRAVDLTCRLYGIDDRRTTNIALFEAAANSLGRSRFFVPLDRRSRWERVYVEIAGSGVSLLFETQLPSPTSVAPVGRRRLLAIAFGTFAFALVLLTAIIHATQPATLDPASHVVAFTSHKARARPSSIRPVDASLHYLPIDDGVERADTGFTYTGAWQHIKDLHDGRSEGTSSRSYHAGDRAVYTFDGKRFKIYGVKGPTGGYAELSIDGDPRALLLFYAPKKRVAAEMYASKALPAGKHVVELLVVDVLRGAGKRRYVNIDGAAYLAR